MSRTYCVVGGGISGLVAAYRLRVALGPAAAITLFDPAERLGGVLRTEQVGGEPMDVGAEAFVRRRPEVPALLAELGLAHRQRETTGVRPLIYSRQGLHPLPEATVGGIPSTAQSVAGLVDAATVARIDAEPTRPLDWRRGDDPAVGALVGDRFGDQVVARSVDPLLSGVYAGSAASIGLRAAAPTLAAALDDGAPSLLAAVRAALPSGPVGPVFGALDGGYRVLLDALVAAAAPTRVSAAVTAVRPDSTGGWVLRDATGATWAATGVIVAVPAPQVGSLLAEAAPTVAAASRRIPSASSAVVALALPGDTALPDRSGVLVASGEPLRAKAITLSSRKWGRGGDVELLRLSFGRFGDSGAYRVSAVDDEQLLRWALEDLATVFEASVTPVDAVVARWEDALPQYGPGHAGLVAELRSGLPPGMAVAGNYLDGIGVPACVAAAGAAVAKVIGETESGVAR